MLCDVKTTDEIKKDHLYSQCPMLVSRCKITNKNLSEYQLEQIKQIRENNLSEYQLKRKREKIILTIFLNLKN